MLDERKLARMVTNRARMRQGRTRTVTLVYVRPTGTAYVATDVVWRAQPYTEPVAAALPRDGRGTVPAARMECPLEIDPRLVSLVAETATPTTDAVAAAPQYEVLAYERGGIAPNRWMVTLKRLR